MILCDICGKAMNTDNEGRIPSVYIQGWTYKHACNSCKYEWQKTLDRLHEEQRTRQRLEESIAWQEFCAPRKPEEKPE